MITISTRNLPPNVSRLFVQAAGIYNAFLDDLEVKKAMVDEDFTHTKKPGWQVLSDLRDNRAVTIVGYRSFWRKSKQKGKILSKKRNIYGVNLRKPWEEWGHCQASELHAHECSHLARFRHGRGWFSNWKTKAKLMSVPYRIGDMVRVYCLSLMRSDC